MRFFGVRTNVPSALAALGTLCLAAFSVQAFDQPPQKTSLETQSKPVELTSELGAALALREANSSRVLLPSDATRRAMGGRAPASDGCGDGVCDGEENCDTCPADCGECACDNEYPGDCDNNQNGLRSFGPQEFPNAGDCWDLDGDGMCDFDSEDIDEDGDCDIADCKWLGTAYPIVVEGTSVDTITLQVNTNFAGGDIYLTGGDASCNPNVFDMRRMLGCVISGLEPLVPHEMHFEPFATTPGETIWAIFVARTGNAGAGGLGFYDGSSRRSHSVAATNIIPSEPGNTFHNQAETGNVGDWTDSHDLAELGFHACVSLSAAGQDPGTYDCVANPDPTGACCNVDGDECQMMRGFECGTAGGVYLGDGTTCDDCLTACNASAGNCCEPHDNAGCDDPMCCHFVCGLTPFCCTADKAGWDDLCAVLALGDEEAAVPGCGQQGEVCELDECVPVAIYPSFTRIQTGPDLEQDGALRVIPDTYGAWGTLGFCRPGQPGSCDLDSFKPVIFDAADVMFSDALFLYIDRGDPDLNQRSVLSGGPFLPDIYPSALFPEIPLGGAGVASDTNGDGLDDSMSSSFAVCNGPTDVSLTFDVTHSVELVASGPGVGVSVLTQTHTITNESSTAIDFVLIRQVDAHLMWIGDAFDDAVGTMTHADGGDLSVYTMEHNRTTTAVTLSSPQAAFYYGSKGDFDPDGSGTCEAELCVGGPHAGEPCNPLNCPGVDCICEGGPIMGCGLDFQQWDAYGLPEGWGNFVANVGYDTDGDSGGSPAGCDGASGGCSCEAGIGIVIPVSLEPGESTCVCIQHTYGQRTPWMGGTCPAGCGGECGPCPTDVDDDGHTGPFDLAMLLGSWGPVTQDTVCLDADQNGGIEAFDLAVLLANWGPCE